MYSFDLNIPTHVYFGEDQFAKLPSVLSTYGHNVLLVYGGGSVKKSGLYDKVMALLPSTIFNVVECSGVEPNPRVETVIKGAQLCKEHAIDVILAVGGGSVVDCSKVIGSARFYDGDPWDLVLKKAPITDCLPIVSILTLSATGSEMNGSAVITNLSTNDKKGIASAYQIPKASFLDPVITYTVSSYQTACGSADILSHLIEQYFCNTNMEVIDHMNEALMKTVIKYAPIAMKEPTNYEARANLMMASSWALNGLLGATEQCKWSCHSIEHQLSAYYDITHGLGLAIITPRWMRYILSNETMDKFVSFAHEVFGIEITNNKVETAMKGIHALERFFFVDLGLDSTLTSINIDNTNFKQMAIKAANNGLDHAYVPLSASDVEAIYNACL